MSSASISRTTEDARAYQLSHYRLLRNVALWLLAQEETYVVTHVSETIWVKRDELITNARHWWARARAVWAALNPNVDHVDCTCPTCTERQSPLLRATEGTQ